jgi:acetyl-CoA synthetase
MPDHHAGFAAHPSSPRLTESAKRIASMRDAAATDPDGFWKAQALARVAWMHEPTKIKNTSFEGQVSIKWFEDGTLNASVSCLDRHLATRPDQVAIIWEGDEPGTSSTITYRALHAQVCRLANVLKGLGVKKGDRVTIYLPMVIEAAVAMLACARIGAIHSVVFGGFSPQSRGRGAGDGREGADGRGARP